MLRSCEISCSRAASLRAAESVLSLAPGWRKPLQSKQTMAARGACRPFPKAAEIRPRLYQFDQTFPAAWLRHQIASRIHDHRLARIPDVGNSGRQNVIVLVYVPSQQFRVESGMNDGGGFRRAGFSERNTTGRLPMLAPRPSVECFSLRTASSHHQINVTSSRRLATRPRRQIALACSCGETKGKHRHRPSR